MRSRAQLLRDISVEITGKDAKTLPEAARLLPADTRVNVTYLGGEEAETRRSAALAARACGLRPVPHLAARRLRSDTELVDTLASWRDADTTEDVFLVGGDPGTPEGPFHDALSVVRTGLLAEHGVRRVGITGYPDGHPAIDDDRLWRALEDKVAALIEQGIEPSLITQFSFDPDATLRWLQQLRQRGLTLPVRVGVPGPTNARRLLGFAKRFGVRSSSAIVSKYGLSLTNLLGSAGPDRFVGELAARLTGEHGAVAVHLYTFGGVNDAASWIADALTREVV